MYGMERTGRLCWETSKESSNETSRHNGVATRSIRLMSIVYHQIGLYGGHPCSAYREEWICRVKLSKVVVSETPSLPVLDTMAAMIPGIC